MDELVTGPRAVCAKAPLDSSDDRLLDVCGHGGGVECAVHFCSRHEVLENKVYGNASDSDMKRNGRVVFCGV